MALPLKNRIKKKSDIDTLFRDKKSLRGDFLSLKVIPNTLSIPRFFISVSLKVSKKAVERNRLKRIITEFIQSRKDYIKKGLDVGIIIQKSAREEDFIADLNRLFNKVQ